MPGDHTQIRRFGQGVNDFLGDPLTKIFVFGIAAVACDRQHGNTARSFGRRVGRPGAGPGGRMVGNIAALWQFDDELRASAP